MVTTLRPDREGGRHQRGTVVAGRKGDEHGGVPSGAEERIGALVAERLGFRYVDEEIITRAAEKQGVDPAAMTDTERRKSVIQRVLEGLGQSGAAGATPGGPMWVHDDATELAQNASSRPTTTSS